MDFRTPIEPINPLFDISHHNKILMIGSCFANNIGHKLLESKFNITLNPFGTLYNPISIKKGLEILLNQKLLTEKDIFFDKGVYSSFYFHSSFSSIDKTEYLKKVNESIENASIKLRDANLLIITFGTAYVYEEITTREVVGNCHKLPASNFNRYRLGITNIVDSWTDLINELNRINPKLKIIFTVSPIRHLRDGAHDNQLSKSTLLLAIEEINKRFAQTSYFPSYEIMMDDLRDYRFYESDMCHPSPLAVDYIWEIFDKTYFDDQTRKIILRWNKVRQNLMHRPLNPHGEEYMLFLKQSLLKLNSFQSEYPFISVYSEIETIKGKINSLEI